MTERETQLDMAVVARAAAKDYPQLKTVADCLENDRYSELSETFIDGMQEVLRCLIQVKL